MLVQALESQPVPVRVAYEDPPPGDMEHPRVEFPVMNWTGWVRPAPDANALGGPNDGKSASDYYGVLRHVPGFMQLRTDLYDEIMTGDGELDGADREFVALATSLTTRCSFCAAVHGRRHFILSRDTVSNPCSSTTALRHSSHRGTGGWLRLVLRSRQLRSP